MKLTNAQVLAAADSLGALAAVKMPVQISYRIARMVDAVQKAAVPFDTTKAGILKEHGTPIEDNPGSFALSPEGVAAYNELLEIEADVEVEPLCLADLGEIDIEPSVLVGLGALLDTD